MRLGYARCSTDGQNNVIQIQRLRAAGCDPIFEDQAVSGKGGKRRQLERCLRALHSGDVLVVTSLDRLGRNLAELIYLIDKMRAASVGFQSLSESIDTTTPQGVLTFHLMGALAQFERSLINERTSAGRTAALARGVRFGRPYALSPEQINHAIELAAGGTRVEDIANLLGCSRSSAYRALRVAAARLGAP
jgi:DNA invertase Pin-like site-specific DNA recombinase